MQIFMHDVKGISFLFTVFFFLLPMSEKMNDIFWIGYPIHVLLAETDDAERFEALTVIHLQRKRTSKSEAEELAALM